MNSTPVVKLKKFIDTLGLENLTPEIDISQIKIVHPDINRPALQLAGFFDHFSHERVQIIGNVEYAYTCSMCRCKDVSLEFQ